MPIRFEFFLTLAPIVWQNGVSQKEEKLKNMTESNSFYVVRDQILQPQIYFYAPASKQEKLRLTPFL